MVLSNHVLGNKIFHKESNRYEKTGIAFKNVTRSDHFFFLLPYTGKKEAATRNHTLFIRCDISDNI